MLLLLVVALALLVCFSVVVFFYFQLKKNRPSQTEQPDLYHGQDLGTCVKCKQQRIIVKKEAGLCAFCWSSIHTKQSG